MKSTDQITYKIISCAYSVHNELGHGFPEKIYQEAMAYEMKNQNIPFLKEAKLDIFYKNIKLEQCYYADFICNEKVIVELKALNNLEKIHIHQILNYLKASNINLGLLINFGSESVQVKRVYL
jgi:GxxExxY protein